MKTENEIRAMLDEWIPFCEKKSVAPYCTYQDGVLDALDWVLGMVPNDDFSPIELEQDDC